MENYMDFQNKVQALKVLITEFRLSTFYDKHWALVTSIIDVFTVSPMV